MRDGENRVPPEKRQGAGGGSILNSNESSEARGQEGKLDIVDGGREAGDGGELKTGNAISGNAAWIRIGRAQSRSLHLLLTTMSKQFQFKLVLLG